MSRSPPDSSANTVIIDRDSPPTPSSDSDRLPVHLVAGSGEELSHETHTLLRTRLRSAALVLFVGFLLFFIYGLFDRRWTPGLETTWGPTLIMGTQLFVTLALGGCAVLLCNRCTLCMYSLRVAEALIFGLPALFFLLMQGLTLLWIAREYHFLPLEAEPWLMLIFTYALFIPNTWRRAAIVVGLMAAAPIVLRSLEIWGDEAVRQAAGGDVFTLGSNALLMALATFVATVGVHTINHLREVAFKAKKFGQYKLKHLIGAGGMGEVYLAEHTLLKRPCAIKLIKPDKAVEPLMLARFEREVRASAKLSHWNSIDIFDYGRADDGTFFYVMEYLPGLSLQELVTRHGALPPERVLYLFEQVCHALNEAHAHGIVHRDIKPANIFAAQRGGLFDVAKLLDFGLAKPIVAEENAQLTQTGVVTGSPLYMSPEQATGDSEPDARSDIYSLGAVMYFALTGKPPFDYDKPVRVMIAHASDEPAPLADVRPDVPDDLALIVMRCLRKRPAERFAAATELAAALGECELAGRWSRDEAAQWWNANEHGKPAVEWALAE